MLQASYGYTALQAGLLVVPSILGALASRLVIAKWIKNIGYKKLLICNTTIILAIFLSYTIDAFHLINSILIVQQLLFGFCMGIQYTTMNSLSYKNLDDHQISHGTSIYSAIIQLSTSFGIAFAAVVITLTIGSNDLSHTIPLSAFQVVFITQSVFLFIALLLFFRLGEKTYLSRHSERSCA